MIWASRCAMSPACAVRSEPGGVKILLNFFTRSTLYNVWRKITARGGGITHLACERFANSRRYTVIHVSTWLFTMNSRESWSLSIFNLQRILSDMDRHKPAKLVEGPSGLLPSSKLLQHQTIHLPTVMSASRNYPCLSIGIDIMYTSTPQHVCLARHRLGYT